MEHILPSTGGLDGADDDDSSSVDETVSALRSISLAMSLNMRDMLDIFRLQTGQAIFSLNIKNKLNRSGFLNSQNGGH